jgi:hypothetical protein
MQYEGVSKVGDKDWFFAVFDGCKDKSCFCGLKGDPTQNYSE